MRRDLVAALAMALSSICLLHSIQHTEACSCMPMHPQSHYCSSDFVILARVKRERSFNDTRIYKVRVRKEYKMSEKAVVALKSGQLLTPKEGSVCGVSLEPGKIYAISGRVVSLKAQVNLCGMAIPWESLTRRQRRGLKAIYRHGCTCKISHNTRPERGAGSPDVCYWTNKCHLEEGTCLRGKSRRCMWTKNRALSSCLKTTNPLTISRWSG